MIVKVTNVKKGKNKTLGYEEKKSGIWCFTLQSEQNEIERKGRITPGYNEKQKRTKCQEGKQLELIE